jgi:hypothetical protein
MQRGGVYRKERKGGRREGKNGQDGSPNFQDMVAPTMPVPSSTINNVYDVSFKVMLSTALSIFSTIKEPGEAVVLDQ